MKKEIILIIKFYFMKKIISLSLLSILLLSSCSIDWNDEKDKKISSQNDKISKLEKQLEDNKKEKEDDLFKKKQECIKLTDSLIKKTEETWKEFPTLWKFSFEQVFYSTKYNNCLWIKNSSHEYKNWWSLTHKALYEVWNDSGSSKAIDWCDIAFVITNSDINPNSCDDFYNKIKELKWE